MLKKFAITVNLITCLTAMSWAQAADRCYDLTLDAANGPSLLRPTNLPPDFSSQECSDIQDILKASGRYPNIFTRQGNNVYPNICFVSNNNDPYALTTGIHALLGGKSVIINSQSVWTTEFKPNLPAYPFFLDGTDSLAGVITRWVVLENGTNKLIGKVFTTDTLDTNQLSALGPGSELDVIIAGTDRLQGAKGSVKVVSKINIQMGGLPEVTDLTGKLCIPQ